jgi:S-adenosylmethionine-diacylglycerol 3-amino-3-carboxypropyl transferase
MIVYGQSWEDPETVRRALRVTPEDDVLAVTSAGCNVLALALSSPRTLVAVDVNPAQNHLLELKAAAVRALDHEALLGFVGVRPRQSRLTDYRSLRTLLSRDARDFWDGRPREVEGGVVHAGRLERFFALFRRFVVPLMHPRERVEALLALADVRAQRRFYDEVWNNRRWRFLFRLFFSRLVQRRLGRARESFEHVELRDVGVHYLGRARHALTEIPVRGNWFVEYILTGTYCEPESMPPYLLERNLGRLREQAPPEVVTEDLGVFLAGVPDGRFSAFYLSDVFEWMSSARYEDVLREIVRTARPGARLCYYNNLVVRRRPEALADALQPDEELARELHRADRSFVYSDVVLERVTA